jgi:hypothetical protein
MALTCPQTTEQDVARYHEALDAALAALVG